MGKVTSIRSKKRAPEPTGPARPFPPALLADSEGAAFMPAPEVLAWIQAQVLAADGVLHNPDHSHLIDGDIEVMWASSAYAKQGRTVLGTTEQVMFRAGGWQKGRQEAQMMQWFGRVPGFLVTLAADFCAQAADAEFAALVEHELYHIDHKRDAISGEPLFDKETGLPKLCMRGHDVEEFVGVVRRYGPSVDVTRLIEAAANGPEVAAVNIARACGTCLERAA